MDGMTGVGRTFFILDFQSGPNDDSLGKVSWDFILQMDITF